MKRNETVTKIVFKDIAFAVAVLVFAGVFAATSLSQVLKAHPPPADAARVHVPSAGRPREVDTAKVKQLIRQGALSGQEARYYGKMTTPPAPPADAPPRDRPAPSDADRPREGDRPRRP